MIVYLLLLKIKSKKYSFKGCDLAGHREIRNPFLLCYRSAFDLGGKGKLRLPCCVWHHLELLDTRSTQLIVQGEGAPSSLSLLYFLV